MKRAVSGMATLLAAGLFACLPATDLVTIETADGLMRFSVTWSGFCGSHEFAYLAITGEDPGTEVVDDERYLSVFLVQDKKTCDQACVYSGWISVGRQDPKSLDKFFFESADLKFSSDGADGVLSGTVSLVESLQQLESGTRLIEPSSPSLNFVSVPVRGVPFGQISALLPVESADTIVAQFRKGLLHCEP